MSALIGALRVTLGLDSAAFEKGARQTVTTADRMKSGIGKAAIGISSVLGGALAFAGLSNLAGQAFEMASAMSEGAQKVGLTVEALQELRLAANQNGVSNEQLDGSLAKLNKSLGGLQLGSKSAVAAFDAIGLSAADLKGKAPEQALAMIADALNKLPDTQQRVAIGSAIMGKSFSQLLPLINGGSKALADYAQQSRDQGQITTEDAQKLDDLADSWDKLKNGVTIAAARIIAALIPAAKGLFGFLESTRTAMTGVHDAIVGAFTGGIEAIRNFANAVQTWLRDKVGAVFDWFAAKAKSVGDAIKNLGASLPAVSGKMKVSLMQFADEGGLQLASFGDSAEAVSVRVAQTFKDMAQGVLGSLSTLSGAIKGGGFLDILGAVVGLGLQLGGAGLFGKGIANNINGVKPTSSGLRSVGSSSNLEWASLSRSAGNDNRSLVEIVDTTGLFVTRVNGQILQAAPGIASAGSSGALSRMSYQSSRRLA